MTPEKDLDLDFDALLDQVDAQERESDTGSPLLAPLSDDARAAGFGIPDGARQAIDRVVATQRTEEERNAAIQAATELLEVNKARMAKEKEEKFGPQAPAIAPENDAWGGEFMRSLGRSWAGQVPQMYGGFMRQSATSLDMRGGEESKALAKSLEEAGQAAKAQGEKTLRSIPAARVDDLRKIRFSSISDFARDINDFVQFGLGQALGTGSTMIAGYMVGGLPGLAATAVPMGVGEMRETLEEAGVTDPKLLEAYGWAGGAAVSALDALVPADVMTRGVKKGLAKYAITRIAKTAGKVGLKEAVTETMQEMVQIAGAASAAGIQVGEDRAGEEIYNMGKALFEKRWELANAGALGFIGGVGLGAPSAFRPDRDETPERDPLIREAKARTGAPTATDAGPATEAIPEDTRALAASQDGETPRLGPGEGQVRGARPVDPVLDDAERFLREITGPEAVTEPDTATGQPAVPAAQEPVAQPAPVPTFTDVFAALPRDEAGDPDVALLTERMAELGKRSFRELTDDEKIGVMRSLQPAVQEPVAARQEATDQPVQRDAAQAAESPAETILKAVEQVSPEIGAIVREAVAPAQQETKSVSDAARKRFDRVLNSKERRSSWGSAAKVSQEELQSLIDEAVKDGRLVMRKGQPVRTGKKAARTADPLAAEADGAVAVPMSRATERRLEGIKDENSYRYAARLLAAAGNAAKVKKEMKAVRKDKALTRGAADQIYSAIQPGAPRPKNKAAVFDAIEAALTRGDINADGPALRDDAQSVPEGSLPEGVRQDGAVGGSEGAPRGDRGGRQGDVGRPDGADADVAGTAGVVPGTSAGAGSDTGTGARDGERGADTPAAPETGLTPDQKAAVAETIRSDAEKAEQARRDRELLNYQITDADEIGKGGPKTKVRGNIAAIKLLREIQDTGRAVTDADKKVLVKYVGWGAFAQDVFTDYKSEWKAERDQIKDLLSPTEYAAARASTLNAHYTTPEVIGAMWEGLKHMGFKGGRALEPAAGIGHYIGMTPADLRGETAWTAVELDPISAGISKALYGAADVRSAGFETQKWPDDFFDLAISNVPFGSFTLEDTDIKGHLIHDYFFVKSLRKVRPGGVVAFITSSGTLDKENGRARAAMAQYGRFLGAVRLPGGNQGAFKGNAGTEVTTDIIFFRKRIEGEPAAEDHDWRTLTEIKTPEGPTRINSYFAANPQMMLGKMRLQGSMYRAGEPVLIGPTEGLGPKIAEAIRNGIPENAMIPRNTTAVELSAAVDTATDGIKEGAFYEKDGVLYRKVMGVGQPQKLNATDKSKIRGFIGIRNVVNDILSKQAKGGDSYEVGNLRETLGKAYDAFVKAHGPINKTLISTQKRKDGKEITIKRQPTLSLFEDDPDAFKVSAIEVYDEKTGEAKKAAIFTEDIVGAYVAPDVKGPADALAVSLNEKGKVDIELIASRLGVTEAEAIVALGDQIYLNPNGEAWQTRAEYLSGDVVEKLDVARTAAELDPGRYMRNVEALEAAQPEPLTRQEITVPFGAPWVPAEIYESFLKEKLGGRQIKLGYNDKNARWNVLGGYFGQDAEANFATTARDLKSIIEYALNSDSIRITAKDADGNPVRQPEAEAEARARVDAIREMFTGDPEAGVDGWIWEDMARAERVEALYNHTYNRLVPQQYDGSHLSFPGLARVVTFPDGSTGSINLLPHRVNAIWRVIQKGNTLFNHVVGSGKTWTSIMAAMEMKRLGMIQRPMFVVPNHMLNQFAVEFYQAYPNAKLLIATKDQMSAKRRREFAAKAAADRWDGIIITHSAFTRIGMSQDAYKEFYTQQIDELVEAKEQAARDEGKESPTVKDLEKARKSLETKLKKLTDETSKDAGVQFEELGVDYLIVDEAHLFKSLHFATRHTRVKGIANKGESKRATDLFIKMRHLEKSRPGRSALFLTGTPVSNTMAELFTMQRYLQEPALRKYGLSQFDSWAGTFGKIVTKSELSSDSRSYVDTESFSQFVNMPELMSIVGEIMDTQTADTLKLPRPKLKNGKVDVVEAELSELEESAIQSLLKEMEEAKGRKPGEGKPFIALFTQGIQLATDMRLVDPSAPFNPNGKIGKAVNNIFDIWTEGNADPKAPNKAQIVFLDMGVPGSKGARTTAAGKAAPVEEVDIAEQIRRDLMEEANAALGEDTDGEAVEVDESDIQAQALLRGKFNLYEDIKQRLIEKGIPPDQIAFIHDAKNDEQKAKLFEQVRNGDIRVLLGSTGKMGVGTNVQRQLIAMHHLDAPWKPADVEQRDGRILRQGNKNPEVRILRYITKRSFDAYRWQLLDRKSNFIGQLFAGALGVRNAEDIEPPLPEAAALKAAATGNPLIVERAEVEREIRTLEAAERAHLRGQKQAAVNAAKIRTYLETASRYAEAYAEDAKLVTDLSGDNFTVDLSIVRGDPVTVKERKKAGEAIRAYLLSVADRSYYGRKSDVTIGKISGFEMAAEVERTPDGFAVQPMIAGRETYRPNEAFLLTQTSDPVQIVRRWERLVAGVQQHVEAVQANIAKNTADLPKLEEAARPKPFAKSEMLDKSRGRLQEIIQELNAKPVAIVEEDSTPLEDIINPIDRNGTVEEQLAQIAELTAENKPILDAQLRELDAAIGTTSNANIKKPETIASKASRPSILATKPWHTVAHIRDTLRFQTKISTFDQIEKAAEFMLARGYRIVKIDTAKMIQPKEWGWRFAGFDLRAPNGQLIEWYIIFGDMYVAKKKGHLLFEKWRNASGDEIKARYDEYRADVVASNELYLEAFENGLRNSGYDGLAGARADISSLSASLPSIAAKFSERSSAAGGVNSPRGIQGPSALSRNLSSPAGSITQQRPESLSSSTSGLSISDTSSIGEVGIAGIAGNVANGRTRSTVQPPADRFAIRALASLEDPVMAGHVKALVGASLDPSAFEAAVSGMASDRRLTTAERRQIAEAYTGRPTKGDPLAAVREAFDERYRDARAAFERGYSPEAAPSNLNVRPDLDRAMVERRLNEMAERLPKGVSLVLRNAIRIREGDQTVALEGAAMPGSVANDLLGTSVGVSRKVLAISLEYGPDTAMRTFTHEEVHILRSLGVIGEADWQVLERMTNQRPKKARALEILNRMLDAEKLSPELHAELAAKAGKLTYREIYRIDQRYGPYVTEESQIVEEVIAHAAADWADGVRMGGPVERVMLKIREFIEAVQNALYSLGFRHANDVFESIWSGELVRKFEAAAEARAREVEVLETVRERMVEDGIVAMAVGPRRAIEEVWGTKFQTLMSEQYQIAVAGDDVATQYDILSAKYNNALSDPPEMREAMKAEIDRLRPIVEAQEAELRADLKRRFSPDGGSTPPMIMYAIAGESAATADRAALDRAEEMERSGSNREAIWKETGWWRGVDGRWRFEIDDSQAQFRNIGPATSTLDRELTHTGLFDAYPELGEIIIQRVSGSGGSFMPGGMFPSNIEVGKAASSRLGVVLHEAQHAIQDVERFAMGGSPDGFTRSEVAQELLRSSQVDGEASWTSVGTLPERNEAMMRDTMYRRLAGEVEARAVQARMKLTPKQRKERAPWLDYDIAEDKQIVRLADGEHLSERSYSIEPPVMDMAAMRGQMMFAIRAYHGSPYDIDQFRMSEVGTGEGAQAYGWGLYFAESQGVAEWYRDRLGVPVVDGKKVDSRPDDSTAQYLMLANGDIDEALRMAEDRVSLLRERMREANGLINNMLGRDGVSKRREYSDLKPTEAAVARLREMKAAQAKVGPTAGRLYEVSIEAEQDDFLDWDKPIGEQTEKVRKALDSLLPQIGSTGQNLPGLNRKAEALAESVRARIGDEPFRRAAEERGFGSSALGKLWVVRARGTAEEKAAATELRDQINTINERMDDIQARLVAATKRSQDLSRSSSGTVSEWRAAAAALGEQRAIEAELRDAEEKYLVDHSGGSIYLTLGKKLLPEMPEDPPGTPKGWGYVQRGDEGYSAVSAALRNAGIAGIRYLDQFSRSEGKGSSNFVVFDDSLIQITAKDGVPISADDRVEIIDGMKPTERAMFAIRSVDRAAAVLDRAARMPSFRPGFSMRNLFDRQMRTPGFAASEPFDLDQMRVASRAIEEVPTREIRSVQPTVSLAAVKAKLTDPTSDDGRPPSVFKVGDLYWTNDGNHRIAAAKAQGLDTIRAEVISLEPKVAAVAAARSADTATQRVGAGQDAAMGAGGAMFARRGPTPPQDTAEGETPGLNKVISDLKKTLGMVTSQGLWGFTVRQDNRSMRVRPPSNVRGQFDRETGNVSVRQSRDIKTLAHEGGHYLESLLGTDLGAIKQRHAEALTGDAAPMPAALSEGWARWFESYVLDPDAAERTAPGLAAEFEELLEAERPDILTGLDTVQSEYQRYIQSAPIGEVAAGLSSQYDGTTWRDLAADKALDNISGKLSAAYQGAVDGLHVAARGVAYLLKTADANGIRDADGRPISLKVGDNFYKRLRLFAGAYGRGRAWLEKGVSDLETGRITSPSLKAALERALGDGQFDLERYKNFNQYLVSIRAIAEYDRLDQKAETIRRYDDVLSQAATARPRLADRLQKDEAALGRREDAVRRSETLLRDRRRMLGTAETRLENVQERMQQVMDDIAESDEAFRLSRDIADPIATNAVTQQYQAMRARRQRSLQVIERDQQQALRAVEALAREVDELGVDVTARRAEIAQIRQRVQTTQGQIAYLDETVAQIRRERENASNRGASRPPTVEPRAVHERVVRELGTPEFQEAARMVHEFTFGLLQARRQAGFISDDLFNELAKRKDYYVPFWRDMSDIDGAGNMFPGSGVKKWSMFKKFDGSDRSILMPLEVLSEEAYVTAQQIAFNDVVRTMADLADRVGPGGARIAERLQREETMEANADTFDRIRQMAIDLGVDPADAHLLTQRAEMNFSDGDIRVIMSPENLGPMAKPQLPLWVNGERQMIRLPDREFGRAMFDAVNGLGKEMSDVLVKALALPAQALRIGVTSHPDFIFRNIWRDIWTAWKLTGALPFVTQARGFRLIGERGEVDGMSGEDFRRLYNEAGGLAGGMNVNAQVVDQRRDVKDLLSTNIDKKAVAAGAALGGFTGLAAASSLGSMIGLIMGGPVGAGVGFKIGAAVGGIIGAAGVGYAARHGEVWRAVESVETATRLGVAAHAYRRAREHDPSLSEMEAMLEAAYVSRDMLDWNRRGSKMLAMTRLVTFLNAQIQGLDKQLRQMRGVGDRNESVLAKHLSIVLRHQSRDILSVEEERVLADAYNSYMRWAAITLMLVALYALVGDDDDYQDIKDQTKWTHSWFKSLGIWFRLPKPFELAAPANIGEIIWDKMRGYDQRMGERVVDSLYEVLAPPGLPQAMRLTGGVLFNRDKQGLIGGRSREIVGENLMSRPPHERYHAFTSELAIDLSRAMYAAGVPQSLIPAPVKTDFVLSAAGAYWGREVQNAYQTAKTVAGMSLRPDRKATDFPILRGFTGEAARQSQSVEEMYKMISRDGGEMIMAATEYKQLMDDRGRPAEAATWLASLDPEQRVWALTQYYGSRSEKREHPLERARQADAINREIMRDTITDTLAPKRREGRKQRRDFDEKIELTPAKKTEVLDILARLSQIEARNTMVLLKRPGFEGLTIKDPQAIIDELKAASQPVHDLLLERRDKKVADWPDVQKEWPRYRDRVLKDGVNAF